MTETTDNVIQLPPGVTAEVPPRRKKDTRAAARRAKYRGKNKGDRDASRSARPPGIVIDAPPIVPEASPVKRRATRNGSGAMAPVPATSGIVVASYLAAFSLAAVSAGFSITGLTAIFVGAFWPVIAMGLALELGKLSAVAYLGHHGGEACWRLRTALVVLVAVLMGLNAVGAYGFLAKAHIGHAVDSDLAVAGRAAELDARLSVQARVVADLDRRIGQIDMAVETATAKGRTAGAMQLAANQRKSRGELAAERVRQGKVLADLQVEKAGIEGDRRKVEADLGPVKYLATLLGAGDQGVLRWFILVVALLLDPAAMLLLLAAARRTE